MASDRLKILHEFATRKLPLQAPRLYTCATDAPPSRTPALLDVLLPVTRIMCDDHYEALQRAKHKVEVEHIRIRQLKRRLEALERGQ